MLYEVITWNYIQEIQTVMEEKIVETFKGGKSGGGGAKLTVLGKDLLKEYRQAESYFDRVRITSYNVCYTKLLR